MRGSALGPAALAALLAAVPGCGLTATVGGVVWWTQSDDDDDPNLPPTGSIQTPTGLVNDVVAIDYVLVDPEGDACAIDVRWSTDGGATWSGAPATAATALPAHDGVVGLAASAGGTPHAFLWNSFVDLGTLGPAANYLNVRVRLAITQGDGAGSTIQTGAFPLYNRYTATVAGGAGVQFLDAIVTPAGMARRANGNLVVADLAGHKVVEVDARTGALTVLAGTGLQGFNGDNQPAVQAQLDYPSDVAIDLNGNVLVCDAGNSAVRVIDAATGFITTVVGMNGWGFAGDGGAAGSATLAGAEAINIDLNGDLWIADTHNDRVRFVNRSTVNRTFSYWNGVSTVTRTITPGRIDTVAGGGTLLANNVSPLMAQLAQPREALPVMFPFGGVNVLLGFVISDWGNDRVRVVNTLTPADGLATSVGNFYGEVIPNGQIRTVAGGGATTGNGVGDNGPALSGVLRGPQRLASLFTFLLFIADTGNSLVRAVIWTPSNGVIVTWAGTGGFGYSGDGSIPQLATLAAPIGLEFDPSYNLIIGDTFNGRVRMVNPQVWTGVRAIAGTDVIAVGGTGMSMRGSATAAFTSSSVGDVQILTGVSATSASDVVAVGDRGVIRRWNGSAWNAESSGTTSPLLGVHALNGTNQWAVGTAGRILFWNGTAWSQQAAGLVSVDLNAVHAVAPGNAFAVGDYDSTNTRPTVLRFNGSNWAVDTTLPALPSGTDLAGVHGDSSGNVFVVGDDGANNPVVIRWNGSAWSNLTSQLASDASTAGVTGQELRGVYVNTATSVVAVGENGFITTYNGTNFSFPPRPTTNDLTGVHGIGANDVYVVGSSDTLLHWNNTAWNALVPNSHAQYCGAAVPALMIDSLTTPPQTSVVAVSSPQATAVLASGDVLFSNLGTHEVLRLDIRTRAITAVAGTGGPGFAGDGGASGPAGNPIPQDLRSVWGASATDVWAVGEGSVIARYNGSSWSTFQAASAAAATLHDVHGASSTNAWAVGNGGVILHWDGTAWTAQASPTTDDLRGVFAVNGANVWAVGRRGTILYHNGSTWTRQAGGGGSSGSGPIRDFHEVWGATTSDVWAVGDGSVNPSQGPAWHWNGTAWSREAGLPAGVYALGLRGVYGFGAQDVYAVGEGSLTLHYHDPDAGGPLPVQWTQDTSLGGGPHFEDVFGRAGGVNPNADLFGCGEFGRFADGLGSDTWAQGLTANNTIPTSVTFRAGIAFGGSGPAFVVGDNGTVYRQASPGGAWTLQLGTGQLSSPRGMALWTPAAGGGPILFVCDEDNSRVRAVNLGATSFTLFPSAATPLVIPAGGIVTAHGASGGLLSPYGVAVDPGNGDLYVADTGNHEIERVAATNGAVAVIAGSGSAGFGGDNGPAASAAFATPTGLSFDRTNPTTAELYIADTANHRIRVINMGTGSTTIAGVTLASANEIESIAGTGTPGFNSDGLAPLSTDLNVPIHAIRAAGVIYLSDDGNNRVRAFPVTGTPITVSTVGGTGLAGYGGDPKPPTFALFNAPNGLAWDAASSCLYLADADNSRVRRFRP